MMGASFVQSIVLLTASAFLSRYSTDAFAAVGNAGLIYISMHMFVVGISDGAQILISRRIGQGRYEALGQLLGASVLVLAVIVLLLFTFAQTLLPDVVYGYVKHVEIAQAQVEYISIRSYGLFFAMLMLPIQAYYFAFGKSWVPLVSAIVTAVGNIVLDYSLIFGNFGFPEMGLKGAALAATISDGLSALFLISFLFLSKEHVKYKLFQQFRLVKSIFIEIFKLSFPIVLQGTVALSTWTIFFIWLEQMGKFELTVSQNIRSVYFLAFVPAWGFAAATKTYVSQYVGAKRLDDVKLIRRRIQFLSMIFMLIAFHGSFLYPETIISWINPEDEFISKSADTLRYVSLSMFIFAYVNVFFQSINGIGKTHITFFIEATAVALYALSAFLLIKVWAVDIVYVWSVEYVYFCTIGLLSILYLKFVNWQDKLT
jgi:MATE family multidrug resistance protein